MADVKFRALIAVEDYVTPDGRSIGHVNIQPGSPIFAQITGDLEPSRKVGTITGMQKIGPIVFAHGNVDLFELQPGHVLELDIGSNTSHVDRPFHFTTASVVAAHLGDNPAYPQAMIQVMPDRFNLNPEYTIG